MFNGQLLLGTFMVVVTVVFHIVGLMCVSAALKRVGGVRRIAHTTAGTGLLLVVSVIAIIAIHTAEAWGWASLYYVLAEFADFERALYFSVVTATTLGYGDVTLSEHWQLLGTFEAMGGLLLFGASTAFLLELMRRLLEESHGRDNTA